MRNGSVRTGRQARGQTGFWERLRAGGARSIALAVAFAVALGALVPIAQLAAYATDGTSSMKFDNVSTALGPFTGIGTYEASDGTVAYCLTREKQGPGALSSTGTGAGTYDAGWDWLDGTVYAAIIYNGYPNNTTICGYELSEDYARAATQLAIWMAEGTLDTTVSKVLADLPYSSKSGARTVAKAAIALYKAATSGELTAPTGCARIYYSPSDSVQDMAYAIYCPVVFVTVTFTKESTDATLTVTNGAYSLAGAVYSVYTGDGELVGTITTDENGQASLELEAETTYYALEETAPTGFLLSEEAVWFTTGSDDTEVALAEEPQTVTVTFTKTSAQADLTDGNDEYSFEGATYEIYLASTDVLIETVVLDAEGAAELSGLAINTEYYAVETVAPAGFKLNEDPVYFTTSEDDTEVELEEEPGLIYFTVYKRDSSSSDGSAQAGLTLAGATYLLVDANGEDHYATSDEDGLVSFSCIPFGTVTITETEAPEGYTLDTAVYCYEVSGAEHAEDVALECTSEEDVIAFDIKILKTVQDSTEGASGLLEPVEGVSFEIVSNTTGEVVGTITTDETGYASTEGLWFGSGERAEGVAGALPYDPAGYTVREVESTVPEGCESVGEWQVSADQIVDGTTLFYVCNNATLTARLQIVKVDAETGQTVALAGFSFEILDADGDVIEMTDWYPSEEVLSVFTTDETGCVTLPEELAAGTYCIREVSAAAPYLLAGEDVSFTVSDAGDATVTVAFADEQAMGQATIAKTDAETGGALAGATFDVVAVDDVVGADGTVWCTAGEVVDTVTTGSDGTATTCELHLGTGSAVYAFVETEAPVGYVLDEAPIEFTLTYADQYTEVVTASAAAADEPTEVRIAKVDAGSGAALAGAVFSWWSVDDEVDAAGGAAIRADGAGEVAVATADGSIDCVYDAEQDAWIVDGGALQSGSTFTVCVDGEEVGSFTYEGEAVYLTSEDGSLSEAIMLLTEGEVSTGTTGSDGSLSIKRLAEGAYRIVETDAPAGYLVDGTVYTVAIDAAGCASCDAENAQTDGAALTITVEDDCTKLYVSKYDVTGGSEVEGAELAIYDADGNLVESWTSTDEPHYLEALAPGDYTLVETMTPHTYDEATAVAFTVEETGDIQTVVMYDEPIQIEGEIDKKQEIADPTALYTEADEDGNNAATSVSDDGSFDYTLDYRSTSSTWTDEFTVTDYLTCAEDGLAYLTGITTAQAYEDYDGLLNVWYQTNLTASDCVDESGANATLSDGHANAWLESDATAEVLGDDARAIDYTGWELWAADVSATESTCLSVEDLGLEEGEYVIAIRFEYGRVEAGFSTRDEGWDSETLKDAHDDVDDAAEANANAVVEGAEVEYASAVIHMQVTDDYVEGTVLENAAEVALYRNGGNTGDDEGLEDHDEDEVEQAPVAEYPKIGTTLTDAADGDHCVDAEDEVTLVDTVVYEGLEPGVEHVLTGTLMDVETGEAVTDADGNAVTASVAFMPEAADGEVEVAFTFDAGGLGGHDVVAFEALSVVEDVDAVDEGTGEAVTVALETVVAVHEDLEDEGQTVHVLGATAVTTDLAQTGAWTAGFATTLCTIGGVVAWHAARRRAPARSRAVARGGSR